MRTIAALAILVLLVGCSSNTPKRDPLAGASSNGSDMFVVRKAPFVGATVEDPRRPGVMRCATCGAQVDDKGACPNCNRLGYPGETKPEPVGSVRRSTVPR